MPRRMKRLLGATPTAGWIGRVLLWTTLAVLGALTGLRLAGPIDRDTALGDIRLRVQASWHGEVNAYVPLADWGIRAKAFSGPLTVRVEPRGVDRQALIRAASGDREVLAQAEDDARDAAAAAIRRAIIFSALGVLAGTALSVLIRLAVRGRGPPPGRHRLALWAGAPLLIGVVAIAVAIGRATTTFDTNAFAQPSFYARGEELSQLLQVSERVEQAGERYTSGVQRSIAGYAALLRAGVNLETVGAGDAPVVLISDLHNNTLALDAVERLFGDRPVFFAGDLGHTGSEGEARLIARRLADAGDPVVAVSGNHDSSLLMRRLAAAGVVVLTDAGRLHRSGATDGKPVQRIGSISVAGYPDPLEWRSGDPNDPRRIFSFSERPNHPAEYEQAERDFVAWFDRLPERPEFVMVHHFGLAAHLAETLDDRGDQRPLSILTGHNHVQQLDLYGDDIAVVNAGTGGAGGVFGAGAESVGIATLQLEDGRPPPRAVDLINLDPLNGNAQADRVVPSTTTACKVERVVCHEREPAQ